MKANSIQDIKKVPFFSQFTDEQILNQVKKNASVLRGMEKKARLTGKKVNCYTESQLSAAALHYEKMI